MPEEARQHADAIVTGYAEETWPQLLRDFAAGRMQPRYDQRPGLSLAGHPFARRDLLPKGAFLTVHTFEATRGCIHDCEFCVVPSAWGTTPYQKPVEEVAEDIRRMQSRRVIFLDLNLVADTHYAARLFEALIPLRIKWFGLATVLLAFNEKLLDLAARSGCRGLLVGFESLSAESLRGTRKGFNTPDKYREVIRRFHGRGISLMGCFVFGLDHDTPDVFLRTARFAVEERIDLPRFAILTPFPGTPLFRRLKAEGRILTEDWSLYDSQHVVFRPNQMSPDASTGAPSRRGGPSTACAASAGGCTAPTASRSVRWRPTSATATTPAASTASIPATPPPDPRPAMKLTLVHPCIGRRAGRRYIKTWQMEPLPPALIAGLTPPEVDVAFFDDRIEAIDFDAPTDIAAISVETYTAKRAYQIASEYRRRGPSPRPRTRCRGSRGTPSASRWWAVAAPPSGACRAGPRRARGPARRWSRG